MVPFVKSVYFRKANILCEKFRITAIYYVYLRNIEYHKTVENTNKCENNTVRTTIKTNLGHS